MLGEMLFFNEETGAGLIRTDDGERLHVDRSGFLPGEAPVGRCAGLKVTFELGPSAGEHEQVATAVTLVPDFVGGRARRRRHA